MYGERKCEGFPPLLLFTSEVSTQDHLFVSSVVGMLNVQITSSLIVAMLQLVNGYLGGVDYKMWLRISNVFGIYLTLLLLGGVVLRRETC